MNNEEEWINEVMNEQISESESAALKKKRKVSEPNAVVIDIFSIKVTYAQQYAIPKFFSSDRGI